MTAVLPEWFDPKKRPFRLLLLATVLLALPLLIAWSLMRLWGVDLSVPFAYKGGDIIWQFTLTKMMIDNGWILTNPFLGAPDVAHWHNNAAAQTSAIHSVLLWCLSRFMPDAVATQQVYYLINFSLISVTTFAACRLLKLPTIISVSVGLAYAFLPFRFTSYIYAYLANFFAVPLAVLPMVWILTGRMAVPGGAGTGGKLQGLGRVLSSRPFLVSLPAIGLVAVSDGYFAFFTLLLLGFAIGTRALRGDIRRPLSFVAPAILVVTLLGTALALTAPLRAYEQAHPWEFRPGGSSDPSLVRHPFEAEVYALNLKAMIAPIPSHRSPALNRLGNWMRNTINEARRHELGVLAPFGTLGSLLLLGTFAAVPVLILGRTKPAISLPDDERRDNLLALASMSFFGFLCATVGGVGSLVALVYPTIRAYDRFPIVLSFILLAGGGLALTLFVQRWERTGRRVVNVLVPLVALVAILDQTPSDVGRRDPTIEPIFRAEQALVRSIEAALPAGAMVYQFPHSQYLSNNSYYGWGEFRHVRLYLHSHRLRWSNGAAKNSWVDDWHMRMGQMPPAALATEMAAVGFRGFVVDRVVVRPEEYAELKDALTARLGTPPSEDSMGRLAWWPLPDPGYRLTYDSEFQQAERLVIADPRRAQDLTLPRLVRRAPLLQALAGLPADRPAVIDRAAHPEVFIDGADASLGLGTRPIPAERLLGGVVCGPGTDRPLSVGRDGLTLRLTNAGNFDWALNAGTLPLRIGMREILSPDGARLRWDGGFRVPGRTYVPAGQSIDVSLPLAGLDIRTGVPAGQQAVTAVFSLVQDGNRWFTNAAECRVSLVP